MVYFEEYILSFSKDNVKLIPAREGRKYGPGIPHGHKIGSVRTCISQENKNIDRTQFSPIVMKTEGDLHDW